MHRHTIVKLTLASIILFMMQVNSFCQAQAKPSKINFLDANISIFTPQGRFERNVGGSKIGLSLGYLTQYKAEMPFFIGGEFSYNNLGTQQGRFTELVDYSLVDFDYSTQSNLFGFNGRLLFFPNFHIGKLEFNVEGKLGFKWLLTNTSKTFVNNDSDSASNVDKGDVSLTYGVAGGINYPINDEIYINIKINYLPGLSAAYYALDPNNIARESTLDLFTLRNSNTNIIRWDIGLLFSLDW